MLGDQGDEFLVRLTVDRRRFQPGHPAAARGSRERRGFRAGLYFDLEHYCLQFSPSADESVEPQTEYIVTLAVMENRRPDVLRCDTVCLSSAILPPIFLPFQGNHELDYLRSRLGGIFGAIFCDHEIHNSELSCRGRRMSEIALLHTERRWQRFVLVPLNISFIIAAVVLFLRHSWWSGAAFILIVIYIGSAGSRLHIHRGKGFAALSQGITPSLPEAPAHPEHEALSDTEFRSLTDTMVRTNYAIVMAVVILCFAVSVRWYWALLAGVVAWLVSQPVGPIVIALLSSPRTLRSRFGA
jgi:hypothetical protein